MGPCEIRVFGFVNGDFPGELNNAFIGVPPPAFGPEDGCFLNELGEKLEVNVVAEPGTGGEPV